MRIVLVGATVRAAAQSAQQAGFHVTGIDLFGDSDTRQACCRHFRVSDEEGLDRIATACTGIPVVQVGGLDADNRLLTRLAESSTILGPSAAVRRRLDDASFMQRIATDAGMHMPQTHNGPIDLLPIRDNRRWLCKRRGSSGGIGVRWCPTPQTLTTNDILQQWIPGRSYGATMLSDGNRAVLLGVCRSLFARSGSCPFVYAGSHGPIPVSQTLVDSLERLSKALVAATGIRGLLNVDFLVDRFGTPRFLEINPRWSGSSELIERYLIDQQLLDETGSLFKESFKAMQGRSCEAEYQPTGGRVRYLKRVLFARANLRFDQKRMTAAVNLGDQSDASVHDIPAEGTTIAKGDPVLTLISKIDLGSTNPIRTYRDRMRRLHAAMAGCRPD